MPALQAEERRQWHRTFKLQIMRRRFKSAPIVAVPQVKRLDFRRHCRIFAESRLSAVESSIEELKQFIFQKDFNSQSKSP